MSYVLSEEQKAKLHHFTTWQLADFIDEELSNEYLVPDSLVEEDQWDIINSRKFAAIEYIKTII